MRNKICPIKCIDFHLKLQEKTAWRPLSMSSDFDQFADQLEASIIEEMQRDYSEKVIEFFLHPKNIGKIKDADGYGKVKGPCGDTMEIFLKIKADIIIKAKFITDGCGPSIVCGSTATELIKGRLISDDLKINAEEILDELGGLPEADQHCANLAADTLHGAIIDYFKNSGGRSNNADIRIQMC
jgi:nitrogen fixation protein NifU and related proteins